MPRQRQKTGARNTTVAERRRATKRAVLQELVRRLVVNVHLLSLNAVRSTGFSAVDADRAITHCRPVV